MKRKSENGLKRRNTVRRPIGKIILTLLFPNRCPVCDNIVRLRDGLICRECKEKWKVIQEPFCFRCGRPLAAREQEHCRDCMRKNHAYIRGRALYRYAEVRAAVYRFKYGGRCEYADFFGKKMAEELRTFIESVKPDCLMPVPVSRKRLNRRGYNQAELLAEVMGRNLGVPVYTDLAVRNRDTVPQKELNAYQRQNNLKKAFKIKENDVKLSTIIIIDDIYTTGSTIDALAEALQGVGVEKVYFAVLAIGA
ncbi:MAG: ComF family protein [Lachnospiraceae bacterium]|nr:ComF family protein [Lachnospiraceae bacterium]